MENFIFCEVIGLAQLTAALSNVTLSLEYFLKSYLLLRCAL